MDNDIDYTKRNVIFDSKEPPALCFDTNELQNVKLVVQVVLQSYGIEDDALQKHWTTHRFYLNQFIKFGTSEDDKYHDKLYKTTDRLKQNWYR